MGGYFDDSRDHSLNLSWRQTVPGYPSNNKSQAFRRTQIDSVSSYRTGGRASRSQTNSEILRSAQDDSPVIKSNFDTGHDFRSEKQRITNISHPDVEIQGGYYAGSLVYFNGTLFPCWPVSFGGDGIIDDDGYLTYGRLSPIDLTYYGAQAISLTRPTKSAANFGQFIGEIVLAKGVDELIPNFGEFLLTIQTRSNFFRSLGKDYLQASFGWVPFLTDLNKIFKALLNSTTIVQQYLRDSDQQVRRSHRFLPTENQDLQKKELVGSDFNHGNIASSLHNNNWAGMDIANPTYFVSTSNVGIATRATTTSEQYWFSGAYTYHVPEADSLLHVMQVYESLAQKMLGIRLTPELVWELTPWSWLIDWWTDIGTVTGNAVAFQNDSLVLRYGYLMRSSHIVTTNELTFANFNGGLAGVPISITYDRVVKERVRSTPFGFGLDPSSFSDRQWAILGALGLTKGPRRLR